MKIKSLAPNQTEVTLNPGTVIFFSYTKPIAYIPFEAQGRQILVSSDLFSKTTARHLRKWLMEEDKKGKEIHWIAQEQINIMVGEW